MNNLDLFFDRNPEKYADSYLNYLVKLIQNANRKEIGNFINTLIAARDKKQTIFFIGNGGSAATASHFANDLSIGTKCSDNPFKALSLTDNIPIISAVANDYGYEEVFVRQLQIYADDGDVLVAISASGNSENILKAFEFAKLNGIKTVAVTAFDGGKMLKMADQSVHFPTEKLEYGPAEDLHMILDHLVGTYLLRHTSNSTP